jgi:hypothetical protein
VSVCVHALPSEQDVPFGAVGFEHVPESGLHVPATWHWSDAVQTTLFVPTHVPFWQVSVCVHALPSEQLVPFGRACATHWSVASSQTPTWH